MFSDSNSEAELGLESDGSFSQEEKALDELLAEIHTEDCLHLMHTHLFQNSPPGATGLPGIDEHLLANATHRPSGLPSLNRGDVIEIQGPAASGKTQLLYQLVARCILPKNITTTWVSNEAANSNRPSQRTVDIGGWADGAVVMDIDHKWDVSRVKRLLYTYLSRLLPEALEESLPTLDSILDECMDRLHIFQPTSSLSLACTLLNLSNYHAEHMPTQAISLLVVDTISSFYWQDRFAVEKHKNREHAASSNHLGYVLTSLQSFREKHIPITILANWGLSPVSRTTGTSGSAQTESKPCPFFRQHLHPFPAPFEVPPRTLPSAAMHLPITHHITLTQRSLPQISTESATLEDALLEKERREVSRHGSVVGILRTIESARVANFSYHIQEDRIGRK